jgi:bifunctional UDP-N-acetylglucosamine pyrophosphorylase/glucosamine-1-phosphate N-acetyltransferase
MRTLSLIIPAAGKGSRLGYDKPKLIYPINGSPIIKHLLSKFDKSLSEVVIVCSPSGIIDIKKVVSDIHTDIPIRYEIQEQAIGMVDAIRVGISNVRTTDVAIIWGDQVLLAKETISKTISTHLLFIDSGLTFPTVLKSDPYIQILRDSNKKIIKILQKREGDISDQIGESDAGFFVFERDCLINLINFAMDPKKTVYGLKTGEINLLPFFPKIYDFKKNIYTLEIVNSFEALGINTRDEAIYCEKILGGV